MGIRKKVIEGAVLHEYFCDECQQGRFRITVNHSDAGGHRQWQHQCTHCGYQTMFAVIYPKIECNGVMFIMADALRFNAPTDAFSSGE